MDVIDLIEKCKDIVANYEGFTISVSEGDKGMYSLFIYGKGCVYSLRPSTLIHVMKVNNVYNVTLLSLNIQTQLQDLPCLVSSVCHLMSLDNKVFKEV